MLNSKIVTVKELERKMFQGVVVQDVFDDQVYSETRHVSHIAGGNAAASSSVEGLTSSSVTGSGKSLVLGLGLSTAAASTRPMHEGFSALDHSTGLAHSGSAGVQSGSLDKLMESLQLRLLGFMFQELAIKVLHQQWKLYTSAQRDQMLRNRKVAMASRSGKTSVGATVNANPRLQFSTAPICYQQAYPCGPPDLALTAQRENQ